MGDNMVGQLFGGFAGLIGAANQRKAAKQAAKDQASLIKTLNWDPTTTAELAPTYQRSQSPVARSYLESFLLGNNPDSVMPGDPMAAQKKRQMQYSQNQMFGTPEQRVAQQAAYRATTPWAIDPQPQKRAAAKQQQAQERGLFQSEHPRAVEVGLDETLFSQLKEQGVVQKGDYFSDLAKNNPDVVRSLAEIGDYKTLDKIINLREPKAATYATGEARRRQQQEYQRTRAEIEKLVANEKKRLEEIASAKV